LNAASNFLRDLVISVLHRLRQSRTLHTLTFGPISGVHFTFDNFCAISRTTALEHHSANQFLKAATNLNVVQPKLFQASRQDDLRFSDCTVSVIQILDDADAAFRILGAGLRTVLSVTTMFADKPHRLNGRMRAAILCFDDLASGYRTRGWATRAAGYRAAISCFGTKRTRRGRLTISAPEGKTDVPREPGHFRF
jgi:hypothetical protein